MSFEEAMSRGLFTRGGGLALGLESQAEVSRGFWSEIANVRRETGVRGLWKGVGTTL